VRTWSQIRESRKKARQRYDRVPSPAVPLPVPSRHASNCLCGECMTAGQHRADYDKAKALQEL